MSAPRIAPGSRRAVGLFTWGLARAAGRVSGTGPPNIFTTLGRHRRLFRGWLRFASRLMPRGTLPRRETELVILRVAHLRDSPYELAQHNGSRGAPGSAGRSSERYGTASTTVTGQRASA